MAYFKLINSITRKQRIDITEVRGGRRATSYIIVEPGKEYSLKDKSEDFIDSLKRSVVRRPYSQSLADILTKANVKYEIESCPVCGGRGKKLKYHTIEVYE